MCEMCGYVGRKKAAAPILLEYGKRVEGLWSGYITGIGVQDADGSLEMKKTLGYSKHWEEKFDASALKGTVGFFHSRTGAAKGVGHERYGHPFISDDATTMAVSQGAWGIFAENYGSPCIRKIGNMLLEQGRSFCSADKNEWERYHLLSDGTRVHMSDVVTVLCDQLMRKYNDPFKAMRETALTIREESATMFMFKEYPGHLFGINMNQRLCAYFHEDGISVATCSLAFGNERVNVMEIPGNSLFDITPDGIKIEKLSDEFQLWEKIPAGMLESFFNWCKNTPNTLLAHVMDNVLKTNYPDNVLRHVPTHELFEQLYFDGKLSITNKEYPGIGPENSIRSEVNVK